MFLICEYIKYLLKRKNKFGIHSPFVFNLLIKLEKIKIDKELIDIKKHFDKYYKKNNSSILIEDFGAGSKVNKNKIRKISEIYKTASSKGKYSKLLYKLSKIYGKNKILELGTNLGIGTLHLSLGNKKSTIISVEGCKNTLYFPKKLFKENEINNVDFHNTTFIDFLKNQNQIYDLIFIDGHHESKALNIYLELLMTYIHDDTVIIIDDIRWNKDMFSFWKQCINNTEFHVSIDFFRMGIIAKKTGQAKQHFVLKI